MRWDSPIVLAFAGTLAIHTIIVVCVDAIVVAHPLHPDPPPPHVELFDIKYEPPPPPPPPEAPVAPLTPTLTPAPTPVVHSHAPAAAVKTEPPPPPMIAPLPAATDPGNAPVLAMADIAPSATGVPVTRGKPSTGALGRGGAGTGTGSGSGSGSGEAPMSVATIKTRALPRGDFSYYDLGRDYPEQAKQLGIEGDIRVKLVVDEHGKVVSRTLLNHLGHGLDELAMTRAAAIEFTPARDTEDRPVASVVVWTFHMTLPK